MFGKNYYNQPVAPIYTGNNPLPNYSPAQLNYGALGGNSAPINNPQYNNYSTPQNSAPKTNMIFVTGLEEAYQRNAMPNSQTIYFDQDKPYLYNILTDAYGKKTYETFEIVKCDLKEQENKKEEKEQKEYITKEEFLSYQNRTNSLIDKLRRIVALEPENSYTAPANSAIKEKPVTTEVKGVKDNG